MVTALLNRKKDQTYWPTPLEQNRIEWQFTDLGIPGGCVGLIDGCHIVLSRRPGSQDAGDFFNRKNSYLYNVQMVADANKLGG